MIQWAHDNFQQADDKLTRRLGWFTRAHPKILDQQRMLVGLYSDGFSFSMVAITDDWGIPGPSANPLLEEGASNPALPRSRTVIWSLT